MEISLENLYVDIGAKRVNSIDCDNNFCSMTLRSELYLPGKKSVQEEPVYAYEIHTGATEQQSNIQVYLDFIIIAILQSLIFGAPTFLVSQLALHPHLNVLKTPQQYKYFHSMQYWRFGILKN